MMEFLESKFAEGLVEIHQKIKGNLGEIVKAEHTRIDEATEDVKKLYAAAAG